MDGPTAQLVIVIRCKFTMNKFSLGPKDTKLDEDGPKVVNIKSGRN